MTNKLVDNFLNRRVTVSASDLAKHLHLVSAGISLSYDEENTKAIQSNKS